MRKITQEAINALIAGTDFYKSNTQVSQSIRGSHLYLFGNEIALLERDFKNEKDIFSITTAGWDTNTTRERLRGIPGVNSLVKKGELLFLNGKEWDGKWITL